MKPDEFLEFVKKRRSIRSFKPDPIPDGWIEEMLEAARWAPSPINGQPWEFIVVKNDATRTKIAEIIEDQWQRSFDIEKTRVQDVRHPKFQREENRPIESWGNAPVIFVMCGDPRAGQAFMLIDNFYPLEGGQKSLFYKSVGNATLLLTLAAAAHGLGAVWISVPGTAEPALKELLSIPVEISVQSLVPVGYPSYEPAPSWRRELSEMVHYEKYDMTKFRSGDDVFNFLVDHRKRQRRIYPKRKES